MEREQLEEWAQSFEMKYNIVGTLVKEHAEYAGCAWMCVRQTTCAFVVYVLPCSSMHRAKTTPRPRTPCCCHGGLLGACYAVGVKGLLLSASAGDIVP